MRSGCGLRVGMLLAMTVAFNALCAQQFAVPDWQTKAGGTMEFEVASVRLGKPDDELILPGFPTSADDSFHPTGGLFKAELRLVNYITFAYKVRLTRDQVDAMLAPLPNWVRDDRFVIEGRAPATVTKDQYRLMMQSLLAERFGLKLHFEPKETAVLLMEQETPGKLGPKLRPHSEGPPCDAAPAKDTFPMECSSYQLTEHDGMMLFGSRNTTMALLSGFLGSAGAMTGEIGRPVVDDTGLKGSFDFTLEIAPARRPGEDSAAEETPGPTFLQAVKEQLGLRLKPGRAVVPMPVIDHIELPSEN